MLPERIPFYHFKTLQLKCNDNDIITQKLHSLTIVHKHTYRQQSVVVVNFLQT